MKTPIKFTFQLLAGLGLASVASLAAAGGSTGAVITYGPLSIAAPVPTLSGSLLIALSVLLMLVALRLLKNRPHAGANLVIAVVAVAALATGAGGTKLLADAYAGVLESQMTNPAGGTLEILAGGSRVVNATEVPQQITKIQYTAGCSNQPPAVDGAQVEALADGVSVGACSTSTTLAAQSTEYCDIEVFCPVSTCAFAWNPNFYVDFSGSNFVGSGNYWSDPECTVPNGNLSRKWVFSPSGQANATDICIANMGAGYVAIPSNGPLVFECVL
jgi:hypothetical protein